MHIGQIGCGRWGANILRDLHSLGAEVSVVARSEESRERARRGNAARMTSRISELGPVDGLIVSTTTLSHYETLLEVADHFPSTPVFCEKALAPSVSQAEELERRFGDRLFVMDKWRYHPGVLAIASMARDGRFGTLRGIQTARLGLGSPHTDVDPIWILLPHDLSIVLEICGYIPAPRTAVAEILGDAPWGMTALLGESPWIECRVSAASAKHQRSVRAYFEHTVVELSDGYSEELSITAAPNGWERPPHVERYPLENAAEMPLRSELQAFLRFLQGGAAPKSSAAEGVEIVRTIARLRSLAGLEEVPCRK